MMWKKYLQFITIVFILKCYEANSGVDTPSPQQSIPFTNFRCEDQMYEGGLYADVETNCQVYHICHDGIKDSFMCGRDTTFNQEILACDYWYKSNCEAAPSFYYVNSQIGNTYKNEPSEYGQWQPNPEGATSLGRNNQQGEGNANFDNSYTDNNNVNLPNNDYSDIQGTSNLKDTGNDQGSYNRPESSNYNRPENGNYNKFNNGNENHSQNNQPPCRILRFGSNNTPWRFPIRSMSD